MKIRVRKKDVIWNYFGTVTTIVVNILLLPMFITFLSPVEIGIWYTFVNIGGIVNILDLGFSATLTRNIAYCMSGAKQIQSVGAAKANTTMDSEMLKHLLGTCKLIYACIASVACIALLGGGIPYIMALTKGLNSEYYVVSWGIYLGALSFNLLFFYYNSLLRGVGDIYRLNQVVVCAKALQVIVSIGMLVYGQGIFGLSLSYLLYSISFRLLSRYVIAKYHPLLVAYAIHWQNCKKTFLLIWYNTWRDGLVSLSSYLSAAAMTIVCSTFLSLSESGIYSVTLQIVNGVGILSMVLYSSLQPTIQSMFVTQDKQGLVQMYSLSSIYFIFIYLVASIGVVLVAVPILLKIRPDYVFDKGFYMLMLINHFFIQFHLLNASFISNTNTLPYVKGFVLSSMVTLLLVIIGMRYSKFGIWVIPIVQCGIQSAYNNWKWPLETKKLLQCEWKTCVHTGIQWIKGYVKW